MFLARGLAGHLIAGVRRYSIGASTSFYDSTIERYASQPVEVLSLGQMLQFGRNAASQPEKILKSARFAQREIPKRIARRLLDLQLLPYIVVTNPHIKSVYDNYLKSFNLLRELPPVLSMEDNAHFSEVLRKQLDQHALMLDWLATGLREVKGKQLVGRCLQLDAFFDSMLRSRISRRVIAEQHLQLLDRRPGYIGMISTDVDVADAVDLAAQKTRQVCMETYGTAPEVLVTGDKSARVPYISAHLDYMLYELLKNSARAVVEQHSAAPHLTYTSGNPALGATPTRHIGQLPPIVVRVCQGQQSSDLTIKISDQGGGIPHHMQERVWSYGFTTVGGIPPGYENDQPSEYHTGSVGTHKPRKHQPHVDGGAGTGPGRHWRTYSPAGVASGPYAPQPLNGGHAAGALNAAAGGLKPEGLGPGIHDQAVTSAGFMGEGGPGGDPNGAGRFRMAGLGFGLPLSRLYARYFGGDLTLQVVPGYGTDSYLTIRSLGEGEWMEQMDEPAVMQVE